MAEVYVCTQTDQVAEVDALFATTANPENPSAVNVSRPSAALTARLGMRPQRQRCARHVFHQPTHRGACDMDSRGLHK
jgi:hypothetical protein